MTNEQELYDTLETLRAEYLALGTLPNSNDKAQVDNLVFACSVAHSACQSNAKKELEQAEFFLNECSK
jgi:hypothetical protein